MKSFSKSIKYCSLIILLCIIAGCTEYTNVFREKVKYFSGYTTDSGESGICSRGIRLGELPVSIVFKHIQFSTITKKLKITGVLVDYNDKLPLPFAVINLGKMTNDKIYPTKPLAVADSLGHFSFMAKIDTGSVLYTLYAGYGTIVYKVGSLVKK
jgi:hypothetical protein